MDIPNEDIQNQAPEAPRQAFDPAAGKRVSPYADSPYISYYEQTGQEPPEMPAQRKREKKPAGDTRPARRWLSALLVLLLVFGCCTATALIQERRWQQRYDLLSAATSNRIDALRQQLQQSSAPGGTVTADRLPTDGLTPAQIYQQNVNAVVAVRTNNSTGTGFLISEDGYVVSNYHVVEGGVKLQVITVDDQTYDAQLIGYDKTNDVSLLKIEASGMSYVTIGSSDELQVGDQVVAIGNALGELTATLTVGYISGKDRIVSTDGTAINMLQTDASINSGNSGGPLFNVYGEVVGITTAKDTGNSSSGAVIEGIGFAIPINDVFGMVEDIRDYGYVTGPYLGVSVRDVDAAVIQNYGFPAGAYVVEVVEGLCAYRAGVKAKDIIVNIGGYEITSVNSLSRVLRKFEAGDTTTLTVFRGGAELHLEVTFDEKPQPAAPEETLPVQDPAQQDGNTPWWYEYFAPFFGQG